MKTLNNVCPEFYMPAEFAPHHGTLMIWPYRAGSWRFGAKAAREAFAKIILELSDQEDVYVFVREEDMDSAREMLLTQKGHAAEEAAAENVNHRLNLCSIGNSDRIHLHIMKTDDAWARDTGATFVIRDSVRSSDGTVEAGARRGIDWKFNAWGGTYDGLYASWEEDQKVAGEICKVLGDERIDCTDFVLEGGSIHTDGEGTLLTTAECLLSPGRNPQMTKEEIEQKLCKMLGVQKIIWLEEGIYNDETNGHVDNMCAFTAPGEIILAWTDDRNDPQYQRSHDAYEVLKHSADAKGRPFVIHKLPVPEHPICITEEDLAGYEFEPGEDTREVGERLAASYVNFYIANGIVLVPQFGGENTESDRRALEIIGNCFPDRKIVPVFAAEILAGGGNIHCITQQIPAI